MKDRICKAFCDGLEWRKVPAGYAVTTPFSLGDGDPVMFYVIEHGGRRGTFRIEDDGTQVPLIEASGVDLGSGTRAEAFQMLLSEYGIGFDPETRTIRTAELAQDDVPAAALKFVAAVLRLQDLVLLHPRMVRTTFREDALSAIHAKFDGIADVAESAAISDKLAGYTADVVIASPHVPPLAVYLGTSDERALIALVVKMETEKYQAIPCKVILLVERSKENPLREPTYSLAQARLDDVLSFRGVEADAMNRMHQRLVAPVSLQ